MDSNALKGSGASRKRGDRLFVSKNWIFSFKFEKNKKNRRKKVGLRFSKKKVYKKFDFAFQHGLPTPPASKVLAL